MILGLNPAAEFADNSDWILKFLQKLAGQTLDPEQLKIARETGLRHAESNAVSIGSLVKLWTPMPALRDFACALGEAAMPGSHSALFRDRKDGFDLSPFGRGDGVLTLPHGASDSQLLASLKLAISSAQGKPFLVVEESA